METVDNIGWYSYLWFPIVQREVMNFGDDSPDEEVFAAFSNLVRKGVLVQADSVKWGGADVPQWRPEPGALKIAQELLRSKFGFPEAFKPSRKES